MANVVTSRALQRLGLGVLTAAGIAAGWMCGRGLASDRADERAAAEVSPRERAAKVLVSPAQGAWAARVKAAVADDFPQLLAEWRGLYGQADGEDGPAENNLRWLLAEWLVKDREGFMAVVCAPDFEFPRFAGEALARLCPDEARKFMLGGEGERLPKALLSGFASALARHHPEAYLACNPSGAMRLGRSSTGNDWAAAISELAKSDPRAAADYAVRWSPDKTDTDPLEAALLAVVLAWKDEKPTFAEWAARIQDARARSLAIHARLAALARTDPEAAVKELLATKLEGDGDGPKEVLVALARVDPDRAFKMLVEARMVAKDPFTPSADEMTDPSGHNPYTSVRDAAVATAAAATLPDEPARFFAALEKLRTGLGGDGQWQRMMEWAMVRAKLAQWSVDECLTAAKLWAELAAPRGGAASYEDLAQQAARRDPQLVLAHFNELPDAARAEFAKEAFLALPPGQAAKYPWLINAIGDAHMHGELGARLTAAPEAYAPMIAAMTPEMFGRFRNEFVSSWAANDPEAAARWLTTLPDPGEQGRSAAVLTRTWADYDIDAAAAWVAGLPDGQARDGAASALAYLLAASSRAEALNWARVVRDPATRAKVVEAVSQGQSGDMDEGYPEGRRGRMLWEKEKASRSR